MAIDSRPPKRITLDIDATDDTVHGLQEGRHFSAYYDSYCYLPLYIFCGRELLCSRLYTAAEDPAIHSVEHFSRIIGRIRQHWPKVNILIRGDGGFCRNELMDWCEANRVKYVPGLPKNSRLLGALKLDRTLVKLAHELTGKSVKTYAEFRYRTHKTWSLQQRKLPLVAINRALSKS